MIHNVPHKQHGNRQSHYSNSGSKPLIIEIEMHSHTRTRAPGDIDGYVVLAFCWFLCRLDSSSILGTGAVARARARVSNSQKHTHKHTTLSPSPSFPRPSLSLDLSRLSFSLSLSRSRSPSLSLVHCLGACNPAYLHAIETTENVRVSCSAHRRQARGSSAWRMCMYFHGTCYVLALPSQNTACRALCLCDDAAAPAWARASWQVAHASGQWPMQLGSWDPGISPASTPPGTG